MPTEKTKFQLKIKSDEERYVLGEVYFPNRGDTDDDFMDENMVRKFAHEFIMKGNVNKIDKNHNEVPSGNLVAESFVVRGDNDPDGFAKGAWVIGAYITQDEDWHRVKSGEFNGWSWSGPARAVPVLCDVNHPLYMEGTTEKWPVTGAGPFHEHTIMVKFDENGRVIPAFTDPVNGHQHLIVKTTATETTAGHAHRIVIDME
jgi:hypothetical protein